jgi:membrane protein
MDPRRRSRSPSWLSLRIMGARGFLTRDLWTTELGALPTFRAIAYKISRVCHLAVRGFVRDNCMFRASGLTYITVLSLVPLLAFSFSVAKGLGAYERLRSQTITPFLDETIGAAATVGADGVAQTGDHGAAGLRTAIDRVLQFVEQTNLSSLGAIGLLILVYTVVKLLSTIEKSLNQIWGVQKSRSLTRKFADYLSMVVLVPLFLGAAASANAAAQSSSVVAFLAEDLHLGPLIDFYLRISSLVAMWIGFTLVYLFMPNTRTRLRSGLIGGIIGGSLWHLAQVVHVKLQVGMAGYNALYSSFAAFPIFMVWIYVSWVTVLLGAEFAYAHHSEPAYRQVALSRRHDQSYREVVALRLLGRVAAAFLHGRPAPTVWQIADDLGVPEHTLGEVVTRLREGKVLVANDEDGEFSLLPARDLASIRIKHVIDALKGSDGRPEFPPETNVDRALDEIYSGWEKDAVDSRHNFSLRELAERVTEAAQQRPGVGPLGIEVTGAIRSEEDEDPADERASGA